jgi:sugar phosphate isomerase/epimerase
MIKFSCADFTFPIMERVPVLKLVKLLGFSHVDIGLFARSSHFSPVQLQASPRSYTAEVIADLKAAELDASDVFLQIGDDPAECAANDPSSMRRRHNSDAFSQAVEFCVAVGSKHLTGLPGVFHPDVAREDDLLLATEEAARRVAACADAGLVYSIEPHVGSICPDVESTQTFLAKVPGLTLTLDYGHFVMAGESCARVHPLLNHASHIHVRGGAVGRLQTSVMENAIDFSAIVSGLARVGYQGFLALEYVWIDWNGCNRCDNVSETLLLRDALRAAMSSERKGAGDASAENLDQ